MGRPPVYLFRWGITGAALVSLVGCAQPNDQERSSMSEATQGSMRVETRPVYFGRFEIDVPINMTLETERYVVGNVSIENISTPVPEAAYDSLWRDRVARIGAEVNEDTRRSAEIVENVELAPGVRAVFYHGAQFGRSFLSGVALIRSGSAAVWLRAEDVDASLDDLRRQLNDAVKSTSLGEATSAAAGKVFHAGRWRVASPPGGHEGTYMRFVGDSTSHVVLRELKIRTEVVEVPEDRGAGERFANLARDWFGKLGVAAETIRAGKREAAGLSGEELVVRMKSDQQSMLGFKWEYRGIPDSAEQPAITFEAQSASRDSLPAIQWWDRSISSFRRLR